MLLLHNNSRFPSPKNGGFAIVSQPSSRLGEAGTLRRSTLPVTSPAVSRCCFPTPTPPGTGPKPKREPSHHPDDPPDYGPSDHAFRQPSDLCCLGYHRLPNSASSRQGRTS